jgi:hypothetical protein
MLMYPKSQGETNQGCSRKRAGRSQQGVIAKEKKRKKEEHFFHPKNSELLTEL